MTELSFLIDLLLNHELEKKTKDSIAERIKEVEAQITCPVVQSALTTSRNGYSPLLAPLASPPMRIPQISQAQSTLDAMARHELAEGRVPTIGDLVAGRLNPPEMPPIPVEQVAQTQAAAQAMNSRHQAIAESIAGKVDKVTGRPRKW